MPWKVHYEPPAPGKGKRAGAGVGTATAVHSEGEDPLADFRFIGKVEADDESSIRDFVEKARAALEKDRAAREDVRAVEAKLDDLLNGSTPPAA